jgi:hypothetical protein
MFGNFFKPPHGDINGIITPKKKTPEELEAMFNLRRGFLTATGKVAVAGIAGTILPTETLAKVFKTENGTIEKADKGSEKSFTHEEINKIFDKGSISINDYYFTDILMYKIGGEAKTQQDTKFIKEKIEKSIKNKNPIKKIKVPVAYSEKNHAGVVVYDEDYALDLPVSEEIKIELEKAKNNTNNGKIVKKIVGDGLIAEAETIKGRGWVILPPGTLLAKVDDRWCIASCLNPVYQIDKRPCPPCKQ